MDQRLACRRRTAVVAKHLHVSVDQSQWRAQVVSDRVRERLQLAIRHFQLGGTLGDAPFEILIQDPHFVLDFRPSRNFAAQRLVTSRVLIRDRDLRGDCACDCEIFVSEARQTDAIDDAEIAIVMTDRSDRHTEHRNEIARLTRVALQGLTGRHRIERTSALLQRRQQVAIHAHAEQPIDLLARKSAGRACVTRSFAVRNDQLCALREQDVASRVTRRLDDRLGLGVTEQPAAERDQRAQSFLRPAEDRDCGRRNGIGQ